MKKFWTFLTVILLSLSVFSFLFPIVNAQEPPPEESSEGNFVEALQHSTKSIKPNIRDGSGLGNLQLEYYIIRLLDLLIPVVISAGVVVVMIGAYKMMSTEKEDAIKEGGRLVIYGVIGIIIMVSAKFIGNTLVDKVIVNNINAAGLQGIQVAESLYDNIMLPFLKILAYLSAGILFFIMAMRVFSFLVSQDEAVKKKATWLIIRSVIGIIIILAATQVVEAVFGNRESVIKSGNTEDIAIGTGIYEVQTIPIIYNVINRIMGLTTLAVLVLIIFQTFQLLTKPDSADNIGKIKKTLMYVAIGVVVIGAGYVISNVLIVN